MKKILGFLIVKKGPKGDYYYARKRIGGKLYDRYLGKNLDNAEVKIQNFIDKFQRKKVDAQDLVRACNNAIISLQKVSNVEKLMNLKKVGNIYGEIAYFINRLESLKRSFEEEGQYF